MSLSLRHTENSHVKQNLVHTLYQVRKYGQMPVEKFHGIITPAKMDCALKYKLVSWYSFAIIYSHIIDLQGEYLTSLYM
jgi:hypothetical protein